MTKSLQKQLQHDYHMLERQRKALRFRLYRLIDELEGRPVKRRTYQPFPFGVLEKVFEQILQGLEEQVRRLVGQLGKRFSKPVDHQ